VQIARPGPKRSVQRFACDDPFDHVLQYAVAVSSLACIIAWPAYELKEKATGSYAPGKTSARPRTDIIKTCPYNDRVESEVNPFGLQCKAGLAIQSPLLRQE
jgi:hypothetical protein